MWRRFGLRRVTFARHIGPDRAFPDDVVSISLTLENRKLLPLAWLNLSDRFPVGLNYGDLELNPSSEPNQYTFDSLVSAWPFERVEHRFEAHCRKRGRYRFGPATLTTGDPFGFAMRHRAESHTNDLLVYPRILPIAHFGLPASHPFGEAPPVGLVPEDPLRFLGTRQYVPGDPPQQIHWRATARTNRLQSKTYERSANASLGIFLDLLGDPKPNDDDDEMNREWAISAAASIAAYGLDGEREVGLVSNAPLVGGARSVRVTSSRQRAQLMHILELLAQIVPHAVRPIGPLLENEAHGLGWGATILVVTVRPSEPLVETLWRLQRRGFKVTVLVVGNGIIDFPDQSGFTIYRWQPPGAKSAESARLQLA